MKTLIMILNAELLLLLITCVQSQGQTCDNGWFGKYPSCQYKCHCDNATCYNNGNCPGKCERGWFGPACQYADLVALNSTNTAPTWLYDSNDSTCNSDTAMKSLTIELTSDFPITWIRLVTDINYSWGTSQVTLKFTSMSGSQTVACTKQSQYTPTNQTLDIYCDLKETIKQVIIEGSEVQSLCSVYISGGRNVALKQTTGQSSTFETRYSYYAVDGDTNRNYESCTHTDNHVNEKPYWTVTFTSVVQINRYVLYNRQDCCAERLGGFILTSFNAGNQEVFSYTDQSKVVQDVYTVTSATQTSPIDKVRVQTVYTDSSQSLDNPVVTLCEAEMYGDSFCTTPKYGRNCETSCNCYNNEKCFVSTGGCPNGCAEGFYGEACGDDCLDGFYGINCINVCSADCQDRTCDKTKGTCFGCKDGKTGPTCNKDCPSGCTGKCDQNTGECLQDCQDGFYGIHCRNACSANCQDKKCNKTSGNCLGCINEKTGPMCSEACPSGCTGSCDQNTGDCLKDCPIDVYGRNCSLACNVNCGGDGSCNRNTGDCSDGCDDGYIGSKCQDPCPTGKYGHNCSLSCSSGCLHTNNVTNSTLCHHDTGYCVDGCLEHYSGHRCEINEAAQQTDSEKSSPLAVIVAPIVAALVIAVLIALGVILWRGRQQRKESNTYTRPTKNISRNESGQEFSQPSTHVLAGAEASKKTANEEKVSKKKSFSPYESVADDEDTRSTATIESMPAKTVDEMKKPKPPLKPKPTDKKWKSFHLPGTRRNTEKLKDKEGVSYYNTLAGLSETAIDVEKLDVFIDSHKKEYFLAQFSEIPANTKATTAIAQSPEHRMKNRYKNICAYDHSRVHLTENTAKKHGGYINASYVEGYKSEERFIAAQGPTQAILEDFVRMLWEQDIERVVMLTNLIEGGTMKCERYWPEDSDVNIGKITVRLTTTQVFADYTIRRLQLIKPNGSSKNLTQFHFTTWPDKGVPTTPWGLVDFEQRVATYSNSKPIVVHCSAGVGRTGTFIALRNVIKEAEDTGYMDFFTTVQKLRVDRMNMVQTAEQYEFLHKAALVALVCRKTTVTSSNIADRIKELENVLKKKGQSNMEKEFKAICNVCEDKDDADQTESDDILNVYRNSQALANKHKNRLSNILPKDYYRVILSCENEELEDYINAVFVPSFVKHDQQILTQLPLPTTVTDFWRMVTQYQVKLIVAFDTDPNQKDLTMGEYLTVEANQKAEFLHLNVETGPASCGNFLEERHVLISIDDELKTTMSTYKNLDDGHRITHLKCTKRDLTTSELLALAKEIRAKRPVGDCRIVYMCRNGADYSGLMCVLLLLLDRIDNDHCLTVPLMVGAIKAIRPQVIPTLAQYKILYQALKLYNEMSNEYCNFGETSTKKS